MTTTSTARAAAQADRLEVAGAAVDGDHEVGVLDRRRPPVGRGDEAVPSERRATRGRPWLPTASRTVRRTRGRVTPSSVVAEDPDCSPSGPLAVSRRRCHRTPPCRPAAADRARRGLRTPRRYRVGEPPAARRQRAVASRTPRSLASLPTEASSISARLPVTVHTLDGSRGCDSRSAGGRR